MSYGLFDLYGCIFSFIITLTDLSDTVNLEHKIGPNNWYFHNNSLFFPWKIIKIILLNLGV